MKRILALVALSMTATVQADDARFSANDPTWREECGACHVAYPAELLPARSWTSIMSNLTDHFGTDASLDEETRRAIEAFLVGNAGRDRYVKIDPPRRITELRWFRHEHDEEIPRHIRESTAVESMSNCSACHRKADDSDFSERNIVLPETDPGGQK